MSKENKCSRYRITKRYLLRMKRKCRCFYCRSNRQYANLKRLQSAEEKMREWSEIDV